MRANASAHVLSQTGSTSRALLGVAILVVVLAVGLVQGVLPGLIYVEHINYFSEGSVRCMHDLGLDALTSRCHAFGEPVGFPLLTGGPLVALGTALMYLPGVDSLGALSGALVPFDAIGVLGGFALMRRLGAGPWVALGTAAAWGLSPTVVSPTATATTTGCRSASRSSTIWTGRRARASAHSC